MSSSVVYREVGEAAWSWVLDQVRDDDGPWLPETVADPAQAADIIGASEPQEPGVDRDTL